MFCIYSFLPGGNWILGGRKENKSARNQIGGGGITQGGICLDTPLYVTQYISIIHINFVYSLVRLLFSFFSF